MPDNLELLHYVSPRISSPLGLQAAGGVWLVTSTLTRRRLINIIRIYWNFDCDVFNAKQNFLRHEVRKIPKFCILRNAPRRPAPPYCTTWCSCHGERARHCTAHLAVYRDENRVLARWLFFFYIMQTSCPWRHTLISSKWAEILGGSSSSGKEPIFT